MSEKMELKPKCKCGGHPKKGMMCGFIIVGGKICGYEGKCKFQEANNGN